MSTECNIDCRIIIKSYLPYYGTENEACVKHSLPQRLNRRRMEISCVCMVSEVTDLSFWEIEPNVVALTPGEQKRLTYYDSK